MRVLIRVVQRLLGRNARLAEAGLQRLAERRVVLEEAIDEVVSSSSGTSWKDGVPLTVTMTGSSWHKRPYGSGGPWPHSAGSLHGVR